MATRRYCAPRSSVCQYRLVHDDRICFVACVGKGISELVKPDGALEHELATVLVLTSSLRATLRPIACANMSRTSVLPATQIALCGGKERYSLGCQGLPQEPGPRTGW